MIEGGVPKNMGAISGGLEIIWDKKQFLLHPPPPLLSPSNLNYGFLPKQENADDDLIAKLFGHN